MYIYNVYAKNKLLRWLLIDYFACLYVLWLCFSYVVLYLINNVCAKAIVSLLNT